MENMRENTIFKKLETWLCSKGERESVDQTEFVEHRVYVYVGYLFSI